MNRRLQIKAGIKHIYRRSFVCERCEGMRKHQLLVFMLKITLKLRCNIHMKNIVFSEFWSVLPSPMPDCDRSGSVSRRLTNQCQATSPDWINKKANVIKLNLQLYLMNSNHKASTQKTHGSDM